MTKIKRAGHLPPRDYLWWFNEHPDMYKKYAAGEVIDVPAYLVRELHCEVMPEKEIKPKESVPETEVEEELEEEVFKSVEEKGLKIFNGNHNRNLGTELTKEFLMNVKGIGESRANEILEAFQTHEALQDALDLNELSIDLSDSIIEKLKNELVMEDSLEEESDKFESEE